MRTAIADVAEDVRKHKFAADALAKFYRPHIARNQYHRSTHFDERLLQRSISMANVQIAIRTGHAARMLPNYLPSGGMGVLVSAMVSGRELFVALHQVDGIPIFVTSYFDGQQCGDETIADAELTEFVGESDPCARDFSNITVIRVSRKRRQQDDSWSIEFCYVSDRKPRQAHSISTAIADKLAVGGTYRITATKIGGWWTWQNAEAVESDRAPLVSVKASKTIALPVAAPSPAVVLEPAPAIEVKLEPEPVVVPMVLPAVVPISEAANSPDFVSDLSAIAADPGCPPAIRKRLLKLALSMSD